MKELENKVVMITGTSRGLGAAMAEAFERAGAIVEGSSRSDGIDVTKEDVVMRWFDTVTEKHGRVDIVIHSSGVGTPRKPLAEVTFQEWEESIAGNLTSAFLVTREAVRRMIPQEQGLIILVSSGVADRPAPTWGPYAAAKWGALGLGQLVAEEVESDGIRVVSVNPSRTRTQMRADAYPDEDPATLKTAEETALFYVAVAAGRVPFKPGELVHWREL